MFKSIKRLLSPPIFPGDEEKTRAAEILNTVLLGLTTLSAVSLVILLQARAVLPLAYIIVGVFLFILILLQAPMRAGYVKAVGIAVIVLFTLTITLAVASGGTVRVPGVALYVAAIVMSGLIIGRRAAFWSAILISIIFVVLLLLEVNGRLPDPILVVNVQQGLIFFINAMFVAILLGIALARLNQSIERARMGEENLSKLNTELEQRVEERAAQLAESAIQIQKRASELEAIAHTARTAATARSLEELLPAVAREVSTRFGHYHAGIFLLDDSKQFAILRAANSDGGQKMLARGHRLRVGDQGIVGFVTFTGNPRIVLDVGEDAVFFNTPDLPDTHAEVAVPLRFGREIIGALDIQSTKPNAFTQEDVEIFTILADQVSVAIQNVRSLDQAQRALQEAELASSQLTGQAWKVFADAIRIKGYRYDGIKPEPLKKGAKQSEDPDSLTVAVQLRGQTIGRLKLKSSDASRKWTEDELSIVESTAERAALAIDSARLLEDAQKRAVRETFLSELAAKFGTSFQLESILRDTVEELGQTLKGSTVTFQLVDPLSPPTADNPNGGSRQGKKSE
jgi:GAF domain-containing protein